jgi:hypothetical protein
MNFLMTFSESTNNLAPADDPSILIQVGFGACLCGLGNKSQGSGLDDALLAANLCRLSPSIQIGVRRVAVDYLSHGGSQKSMPKPRRDRD